MGGLAVATISNLNLMFRLSWCWVGFWRFLEGLSIVITMSKHWLYPYSTPPYLCNHWHTKHRRGDHQLPHQLPFTLITQVATLTLAHWIAQVDYAAKFAALKSASSWPSGSTESLSDSCLFPCSLGGVLKIDILFSPCISFHSLWGVLGSWFLVYHHILTPQKIIENIKMGKRLILRTLCSSYLFST